MRSTDAVLSLSTPGPSRLADTAARALRLIARVWFGFTLRGAERLPPRGPHLLVGNHSGIGVADAICMMVLRAAELRGRPMAGMMHDVFIGAPLVGRLCAALGAVRASPKAAEEAISAGRDVVVYPGGGLDSCRPLHLPRAVVFGDRRGYVRLALKTGVPVVPFATIGSHHTYLLLPWIGDALGARLRRWGVVRDARVPVPLASLGVLAATIACALGAAPLWALALAVAALVIPNPARITTDILEPIDVRAATALIEDPAARVEAAHRLVHGRLAAHVAAMRHGR